MKKTPFFLWPDTHISSGSFLSTASADDVEKELGKIYTGAVPVVFSSARASISAILEQAHLNRADGVWCQPFSSHCVLEAISRIATPVSDLAKSSAAIIYHQWGFIHTVNDKTLCIEDSADSLLLPGNICFPNGGSFQVVSLPKIYGCAGGGIAFCKNPKDAEQLCKIRDTRKSHSWFQFFLKLSAKYSETADVYWNGAEALGGKPVAPVCSEILKGFEKTPLLINNLQTKLDILRNIAPDWLRFPTDRLPCAVPIEISRLKTKNIYIRGLEIIPRHFNKTQNTRSENMIKVLPVPIHRDINIADIEAFKNIIE